MGKVIKRDGQVVDFDQSKIEKAILKAFEEVDGEKTQYAEDKAFNIATYIRKKNKENTLAIEEIQDLVEKGLMSTKRKDVARAYITYRNERTRARGNLTDKAIDELLTGNSEYWNKENSNKNSMIVTTQRDYIAGIASTDLARRKILPREVCKAHDEGIIHQHDMDYMAQNALHNCCLINLEDMLQNGTVINEVKIDKPHKLLTAATIATQIILGVSSSQYGGCTISLTHLAPFVKNSLDIYYEKYLEWGFSKQDAIKYAKIDLKKEVEAAVQTFNYQVNSMTNTNGQAPFLSVLMYLGETKEYKQELAMLIEEFLKQRILGFKNEQEIYITPSFPKLLYVLEEDNINENSKYYYLTKLAAECTAKRMVPDYLSEKMLKKLKINPRTGKGECYACMGCRSFLTPDRCEENYAKALNYDASKGKYYGRANMGVTTINLADIALSSNKDFDKFWKLFDERTELCHTGLKVRIDRLENITSDAAPILWQHGALARLNKRESIHNLIHNGYMTASLGYAALYECVKYMTGYSHVEGKGKDFGLEIMKALNDKCKLWKEQENIDYSVYGSPIESTTYKFAKCLKKRFGDDVFIKIDGKDRNYVTNSFHCPVFLPIDAFSKLKIESEFQELSPGGMISYIEIPNLQNNISAILDIIKYMYNNIAYAEINTKSDYCQKCGFGGEIIIKENSDGKLYWECPNCGNKDENSMSVVRRTCGYLGSQFWNQGRTAEIRDRVLHVD